MIWVNTRRIQRVQKLSPDIPYPYWAGPILNPTLKEYLIVQPEARHGLPRRGGSMRYFYPLKNTNSRLQQGFQVQVYFIELWSSRTGELAETTFYVQYREHMHARTHNHL